MHTTELTLILQELNASSSEIEGSWIISTRGLVIASVWQPKLNEERGGALAAALFSRANRTATTLKRGDLEQLVVIGDKGCILMMNAGEGALLVALTKPLAKFELIFFAIEQSAKRVAIELKKPSSVLA